MSIQRVPCWVLLWRSDSSFQHRHFWRREDLPWPGSHSSTSLLHTGCPACRSHSLLLPRTDLLSDAGSRGLTAAGGTVVWVLTAEGVWVSEAPLRSSTGGGDTDGDLCTHTSARQALRRLCRAHGGPVGCGPVGNSEHREVEGRLPALG